MALPTCVLTPSPHPARARTAAEAAARRGRADCVRARRRQHSPAAASPVIADWPVLSQNPVMRRMPVVLLGVAVLFLLIAPLGLAWREPTLREREQITGWYPAYIRNAPVRCLFIVIHISSQDARYALTYAQPLNALKPHSDCLRYAANGFDILTKRRGKWSSIYSGSVEPPCSLKIPRDLTRCWKL